FQPTTGVGLDSILRVNAAVWRDVFLIFAAWRSGDKTTASVRDDGTSSALSPGPFANGAPAVAAAVSEPGLLAKAYLNGTASQAAELDKSPEGITNTWIGYIGGSFRYAGQMGTSLVYRRALSDSEVRRMIRTLMARWG